MALLLAAIGSTDSNGRITADIRFMPNLAVYTYYGVFFAFGWGLYYAQWMIATFTRHCWQLMMLAWTALGLGLIGFVYQGDPGEPKYLLFHSWLSLMSGFAVTFFIAAFIGIFQRHFNARNETYRYLSDSAYWVFASHSIFIVALAIPMAHFNWPAEVKFLIVVIGATYFSMLTYRKFVRTTWLGELLNGKRYDS